MILSRHFYVDTRLDLTLENGATAIFTLQHTLLLFFARVITSLPIAGDVYDRLFLKIYLQTLNIS